MNEYVMGFAFKGDSVVLIKKNRPDFLAGKLNGVGGRIEAGESPDSAMVREFKEETGVATNIYTWHQMGCLWFDNGAKVFLFRSILSPGQEPKTVTDEEIKLFHQRRLFNMLDVLGPNIDLILPSLLKSDVEYIDIKLRA